MNYHQLGKSTLKVSEIAFGCMSLKGDQETGTRLIHQALDQGINYFDTADIYDNGENELLVGKALREHRSRVIIATKVGNQPREGGGLDWNPRKAYILSAVEESLKRLQTNYIDLYQLHGGTIGDPIDETIEAFELLKKQGKILYYGISSIRPNVIREYVKRSGIVSVMMQYSLLDRRPEESCLELLKENNIGVLARGSVASGLLVNKDPKDYINYRTDQVKAAAEAIRKVSVNMTPAQAAIRFVLAHPAITAAVVGIRTPEQLQDAAGAVETPPLTDKEMQMLRDALPVNRYDQHR